MADRRLLYKYKGDCCRYCSLSVEGMIERFGTFQRMFQFNHVDSTKKHPDYKDLIQQKLVSEQQLNEVDKCILMCNECHGVLHAQDIEAELHLKVEIAGQSAEQTIKGQMIFDKVTGLATFLTNQSVLVYPYRLSLGRKKPKIVFGTQLIEPEDLLGKIMRELAKHKTVVIRAWNKEQLVRVTHTGGRMYRMEHDLRFPLFGVILHENGKDSPITGWVRNGMLVRTNGEIHREGTMTYEVRSKFPLS